MQDVFSKGVVRRFRCFRVSDLFDAAGHRAAGLYGDRGSGPIRLRAPKGAWDISGFSDARLLTVAPYLSSDLPASLTASRPRRALYRRSRSSVGPPCAISAQTILAILFAT